MFSRFLNSAALIVLPSVERVLVLLSKALTYIEKREAALQLRIEDSVVSIANNARARREAVEAVNAQYDKLDAQRIERIEADRAEIRKAMAARDAVSNLINRS